MLCICPSPSKCSSMLYLHLIRIFEFWIRHLWSLFGIIKVFVFSKLLLPTSSLEERNLTIVSYKVQFIAGCFYVFLCYTLPKESPFFVDWAFTKWLRFTNIKTFRDKELRTELKCSTQRKTPQKEIQSRIPQWLQLHILKHIKWNGGLLKRVNVTVENRIAARKENANKSMFISTLEFN